MLPSYGSILLIIRWLKKVTGMEKPGVLDSLRITVLAEDSVLYESPYLGQHGVSFLLEGVRRGKY